MRGRIIRGVGGFYYVHTAPGTVYECRARGIFRKDRVKPLPGDQVEISVISEQEQTGNVDQILPRKNTLIRPAAANVDQAMVIFAMAKPAPNLNLLDRFLVLMARQNSPVLIVFNKQDLNPDAVPELRRVYAHAAEDLFFTSVALGEGLEALRPRLLGKTTVVAGPSGVGKSSMTNALIGKHSMETGEVSARIERGKHTTRHTELIALGMDSYFLDTPGFSSLSLDGMDEEELKEFYPEFSSYHMLCRFQGCMHIHEPDCAVKEAIAKGEISAQRYENYLQLAQELHDRRKW